MGEDKEALKERGVNMKKKEPKRLCDIIDEDSSSIKLNFPEPIPERWEKKPETKARWNFCPHCGERLQ